MLTVALPKGRIAQESLEIFEKVFNQKFEFDDRKLILKTDLINFLLVRNQDVPIYVKHLAADIGIVGLDVLEEQQLDLIRLLDLGIGKCKVCVGVLNDKQIDYNKPELIIASKMPNIAKKYFSNKAVALKTIKLYGSIELAPIVGICDAIVDIVETGATMKQNGLKVSEVIFESSARLIANRQSFITKKKEILKLYHDISNIIKK